MAVRRLLPVECERLQGFPPASLTCRLAVMPSRMDTDLMAASVSLVADLELQHLWLRNGNETVRSITLTADRIVPEWPIPPRDVVQLLALALMHAPVSSAGHINMLLSEDDVGAMCGEHSQLIDTANRWLARGRCTAQITATDIHQVLCGVVALVQPFVTQKDVRGEVWSLDVILRKGYTRIPWRGKYLADCPDGPRYKALGNSMAVPVIRWLGERIYRYYKPGTQ